MSCPSSTSTHPILPSSNQTDGVVAGMGSGLTKIADEAIGIKDLIPSRLAYNAVLLDFTMGHWIVSQKSLETRVFVPSIKGQHRLLLAGVQLTPAPVATPIELVKVKLQLQRERLASDREFKNPIHCARRIIQMQGVPGLWTGLTGSLLFRSNFMWMFMSYEVLMRGFGELSGTRLEINDGLATFMSGGLASFSYWFMAIAADNVKSRMMAAPLDLPRQSVAAVAKRIYHENGLKGFARGLTPILLRAFPVNASALFVYEGLMKLMNAEKVGVTISLLQRERAIESVSESD
ncbi:mitochondrial carrier [Sanghuangporus baumii]|uniref:Mitochondrial carrier n=1 Tax=Sanghuangporus baumii TaxID=108892 RepID=A0A9Q5HZ23_SANBA|nr:mitochondrial carrier [Sanghuangporus baumii]